MNRNLIQLDKNTLCTLSGKLTLLRNRNSDINKKLLKDRNSMYLGNLTFKSIIDFKEADVFYKETLCDLYDIVSFFIKENEIFEATSRITQINELLSIDDLLENVKEGMLSSVENAVNEFSAFADEIHTFAEDELKVKLLDNSSIMDSLFNDFIINEDVGSPYLYNYIKETVIQPLAVFKLKHPAITKHFNFFKYNFGHLAFAFGSNLGMDFDTVNSSSIKLNSNNEAELTLVYDLNSLGYNSDLSNCICIDEYSDFIISLLGYLSIYDKDALV